MNEAYKQALGEVVMRKRREAGLGKVKLGEMTGMNRVTVRRIETGEGNPTLDVLIRLAAGLDIPLSELFVECEKLLAETD